MKEFVFESGPTIMAMIILISSSLLNKPFFSGLHRYCDEEVLPAGARESILLYSSYLYEYGTILATQIIVFGSVLGIIYVKDWRGLAPYSLIAILFIISIGIFLFLPGIGPQDYFRKWKHVNNNTVKTLTATRLGSWIFGNLSVSRALIGICLILYSAVLATTVIDV